VREKWLDAVIPVSSIDRDLKKIEKIIGDSMTSINLIFVLDMNSANKARAKKILNRILSEKNKEAQILSAEFGNPGSARNLGLRFSEAPFISFWDSDDEPNQQVILGEIERFLSKNLKFDILIGNYEMVKNMTLIEMNSKAFPMENLAFDTGLWRMVFRREFLQDISFPNLKMAEDQIFFLQSVIKNPTIYQSNRCFYVYYKSGQHQLTSTRSAFRDIPFAISETASMRSQCDSDRKMFFMRVFLLRQALSGIKNGETKTKLLIVRRMLASVSLEDLRSFIRILRVIKLREKKS
jgi:hypothetical protein